MGGRTQPLKEMHVHTKSVCAPEETNDGRLVTFCLTSSPFRSITAFLHKNVCEASIDSIDRMPANERMTKIQKRGT